jgi:hypothetical protein
MVGADAGTTAGDDEIGRLRIDQKAGEQTVHGVGQRGFVLGRVHAVVEHLMAQRLGHGLQGVMNNTALGGLAVLDDERDLHGGFLSHLGASSL